MNDRPRETKNPFRTLWAEILDLPEGHNLVDELCQIGSYPCSIQAYRTFLEHAKSAYADRGKKSRRERRALSRACGVIELLFHIIDSPSRIKITSPEDVVDYLHGMRHFRKECLRLLVLDTRNYIVHDEFVSIGTLNSSPAHPREIIAPILEHRGAGFILAHNHPGGCPEPSPEDLRVTRRLLEISRIIEIPFLDHIIVSRSGYYSFRESTDFWDEGNRLDRIMLPSRQASLRHR